MSTAAAAPVDASVTSDFVWEINHDTPPVLSKDVTAACRHQSALYLARLHPKL